MVAEMDSCSSLENLGSEDVKSKRNLPESESPSSSEKQSAGPEKRSCIEAHLNENAPAQFASASGTVKIESSSCDDIIASVHQEHLDIFNADDDRQEPIDYCEKMPEDW